jgi:NTE family protein
MSTTVNAVFEGGGVRGIALAGAAAGAMDMGYRFDHVVGTSAGSLVASLVAAGYGPDELSRAVCSVDWPGLLDPVPGSQIPLVGRHLALLVHRGTYAGDELERVWSRLLAEQGVRSFRDLAPGSLTVVVTDIATLAGSRCPPTSSATESTLRASPSPGPCACPQPSPSSSSRCRCMLATRRRGS